MFAGATARTVSSNKGQVIGVSKRRSLAPMARHATVTNFAIRFELIAGVTLLGVALGALMREVRYLSRERSDAGDAIHLSLNT